jgi:hypothetical protein
MRVRSATADGMESGHREEGTGVVKEDNASVPEHLVKEGVCIVQSRERMWVTEDRGLASDEDVIYKETAKVGGAVARERVGTRGLERERERERDVRQKGGDSGTEELEDERPQTLAESTLRREVGEGGGRQVSVRRLLRESSQMFQV